MKFSVPGKPVGKGRPRAAIFGNHVHIYTDSKTLEYEKTVQEYWWAEIHSPQPLTGYIKMKITAYFAIPKNTSKVKTTDMLNGVLLPDKKPDADNIAKIILDALNGFAYEDDTQIVELTIVKKYDVNPRIEVEYEELKTAV